MFNSRKAVPAMAVAALAALAGGQAQAQTVTISGTTAGTFSPTASTVLTYTPAAFTGTTVNGFLGLGDLVPAAGDSLGIITAASPIPAVAVDGETFTLDVTFTQPVTIQGSNVASNTASIQGTVFDTVAGGAQIGFNPAGTTFNFVNPTQTGSFTFFLNPVALNSGASVAVTGFIRANANPTAVPEPSQTASLGMGLLGLGGLAFKARRRKTA